MVSYAERRTCDCIFLVNVFMLNVIPAFNTHFLFVNTMKQCM
jgi:hypothetical protein